MKYLGLKKFSIVIGLFVPTSNLPLLLLSTANAINIRKEENIREESENGFRKYKL